MPTASEPEAVYGRTAVAHEGYPIGGKRERLSVDEYFDELWSIYLKKRENLRAWVSHNKRWVYIFHIENDTVVIDRIKAAKMIKR